MAHVCSNFVDFNFTVRVVDMIKTGLFKIQVQRKEVEQLSGQKKAAGSPIWSAGVVYTLFGESYLCLNKQPCGGSAAPCPLQPCNTCQSALSDNQWLADNSTFVHSPLVDFNEDRQEVRGRKAGAGNDHI